LVSINYFKTNILGLKGEEMAKHKTKHARKSKSLFDVLKHWLEKRGQGLPMTTIVIIVIVLIVLAVVVVFFFGQFSVGQKTVEGQQDIGTSATDSAKCSAYAAGLIQTEPANFCTNCSCDTVCTAIKNGKDCGTDRPTGCTKC